MLLVTENGTLAGSGGAMEREGMVDAASFDSALGDADAGSVATGEGKVPHTADPIVAIAARGGLAVVAGQDVVVTAGEIASLTSGEDLLVAAGPARGALAVRPKSR